MSSADETFDPYRHWLGIEAAQRPVDHYSLLGLPRFESDAAKIEQAFDSRMRLIRSFQTGPRGRYTQKLLSELASAQRCLLSPSSKSAYDAALFANVELPSAELPPELAPLEPSRAEPSSPSALPAAATNEYAKRKGRAAIWYAGAIGIAATAAIAATLTTARFRHRTDASAAAVTTLQAASADSYQPVDARHGDLPEPDASADEPLPVIEVLQEGNGVVLLSPATATVSGGAELQSLDVDEVVGGWNSVAASAAWHCKVLKTGYFQAQITYTGGSDHQLRLQIDDLAPEPVPLPATGGNGRYGQAMAPLIIRNPGRHRVVLSVAGSASDLRIKLVKLQPAESSSGN